MQLTEENMLLNPDMVVVYDRIDPSCRQNGVQIGTNPRCLSITLGRTGCEIYLCMRMTRAANMGRLAWVRIYHHAVPARNPPLLGEIRISNPSILSSLFSLGSVKGDLC